MMEVTSKLIEGVVDLTKLMAHGAMHEACLIEVVKTIEDEAFELIETVRDCAFTNKTVLVEVNNYIAENNATVLDVKAKKKEEPKDKTTDVTEIQNLLRRMLSKNNNEDIDKKLKDKLLKLQKDLISVDTNTINGGA